MLNLGSFYRQGIKIKTFNIADYSNDDEQLNNAVNEFLDGDDDGINVSKITPLISDDQFRIMIEYYIPENPVKYEDMSDEEKEIWDKYYKRI